MSPVPVAGICLRTGTTCIRQTCYFGTLPGTLPDADGSLLPPLHDRDLWLDSSVAVLRWLLCDFALISHSPAWS